jgi:hypothetical protein
LRERRAELLERLRQTQTALTVLDDKIAYYTAANAASPFHENH